MKKIEELIRVIGRNKQNQSDVLYTSSKPKKIQVLYEKIANGKVSNEDELIVHLYGQKQYVNQYRNLKCRLRKHLLNNLFFIEIDKMASKQQKAYYQCYKDYAIVKILIGKAAWGNAIFIAEKILKKSLKFEFTDLTILLSDDVRYYYATIEGHRKKYEQYNELFKKQSKILGTELVLKEFYLNIAQEFINSKTPNNKLLQLSEGYINFIQHEDFHSFKAQLYAYTILSLHYQILNDHSKTLTICDRALEYFRSQTYLPNTAVFTFLFKKLTCYIKLKKFDIGNEIIKECLLLQPTGTANWFLVLEYQIILCLHTQNYRKAYEVFFTAKKHKRFRYIKDASIENWKIIEAYINLLIKLDIVKLEKDNTQILKSFRLGKFLNDVPIYSKDKSGANIGILIIQAVHLLHNKRNDEFINHLDSMNVYIYRYLNNSDRLKRHKYFFKMFFQIPKGRFSRKNVELKTSKYFEELQNENDNSSFILEIIPYEKLWGIILSMLRN